MKHDDAASHPLARRDFFLASAGAVLQLGISAAAILIWIGVERMGAAARRKLGAGGFRLRRDRWLRRTAIATMLASSFAIFAGLATIAADPARESDVRVAAIQTISQLGEDFATVGALADLLGDSDDRVKQAALEAFSSMASADFDSTDEAVAWWRNWDGKGEREWLIRLNRKRGAEIRVLNAQREALSRRLVTAYRDSFLQLPEAAQAGRLVEFIGDESPDIRRLALDLIGGMVIDQKDVPAEVRTAVLRLLNDSDHDIRRRAAITAGNLRIDGAADVLLKAFDTETQPPIRAAIASALGRFGDARAIDPLIAALDSSNTELVTETAVALGKLASNGTVESAPRTRVVEALTRRFERAHQPEKHRSPRTAPAGDGPRTRSCAAACVRA